MPVSRSAGKLPVLRFECRGTGRSPKIWAGVGAGLANGTLKPVVGREMPLRDAAQAQQAVMEQSAYGKIVLIP